MRKIINLNKDHEYVILLQNIIAVTVLVASFWSLIIWSESTSLDFKIVLQPYSNTIEQLPEFNAWLRWVFGDMTEATFYKSECAAVGMLLGGVIAHYAMRMNSRFQGFPICYGTGLFVWVFLSSTLSLILSNLIWGNFILVDKSWQPTFVAFVSLPAATVLMYGAGLRVALVGAFFGAILITPIALILVNYICTPFGLPPVIGTVSAMAIGSVIGFSIYRWKPQVVRPRVTSAQPTLTEEVPPNYGPLWTVRRVLADFTEAQFFGNEWASIGLIGGLILAIAIEPSSVAYGTGLVGSILIGQILTSAIGVVLWRKRWVRFGWYPTYIPVVSVVPASILIYGSDPRVIITSSLLGAIIAPQLAKAISSKLPPHFHPFIGNVCSMAISTTIVISIIRFIF
ncbi:hypothetical protein V1U69_09410 [Vibrio alginolyticus]|uniref:hypothetical protein n=1 Tax=Vibrio alginolyticus TaxID=663 RepID=UPI002F4057A2